MVSSRTPVNPNGIEGVNSILFLSWETVMRLKVLAVFAALASLSVPHSSRATDFSATTKSIVSSLNQISEIYQKPQITNGDAVAIAAPTCEEIKISIDNGNIQFIAEVVYQYPAKNPGDPAYKQVNPEKLVAIEEDLLTKAGANSATKELILPRLGVESDQVCRLTPQRGEPAAPASLALSKLRFAPKPPGPDVTFPRSIWFNW
jgi:hypothetical protein